MGTSLLERGCVTSSHQGFMEEGRREFAGKEQDLAEEEVQGQIWLDHALIQDVYDALDILPWSEKIRGFSNIEPLHKLTVYLSLEAWFSDVHQHRLKRPSG